VDLQIGLQPTDVVVEGFDDDFFNGVKSFAVWHIWSAGSDVQHDFALVYADLSDLDPCRLCRAKRFV